MNAYDLLLHEHCWHSTGSILLSYPPQHPQFCCDCGERRIVRDPVWSHQGHGPYLDRMTGGRVRRSEEPGKVKP